MGEKRLSCGGAERTEDDDVQLALVALPFELLLRGREQVAHVLLGLSDEPLQNLRPVDDLRRVRVKELPELLRDERLPGPGRAVEQHPLAMMDGFIRWRARFDW
eukprot:31063-Pelagococcus_subviridis.AAC.12